MSLPKIIAFVGKMQAGKTTSANILNSLLRENNTDSAIFSFADELKKFCIENEWITKKQAYGSQEEKNSLTLLLWKNMPDMIIRNAFNYYTNQNNGQMTAREVLQHIGTEIFRRIDNNIWVKKCFKNINSHMVEIGIIDDCRFIDEILSIKNNNGIVIYLTRNLYNNNHSSETELDNFDKSNFDYIIDNKDSTLDQLQQEVTKIAEKILNGNKQDIG